MNKNQVYNKAVDDVWELLRGAWFNYFYHEDMAAHYGTIAFWLKIATPILIVLGVGAAMWPAPAAERAGQKHFRLRLNSIIAIILAGASIVTWVMTPDGQLAEHTVLSKEWLAVVGEVQKVNNELLDLGSNEAVSPVLLAKIELFGGQEQALYQGEIDSKNQPIYDSATIRMRRQLYGYDVKTHEDAVKEYERRKKLGLIPWRETADGKATPSKKGAQNQPSDRSLLSNFSK